MEECDHKWKIIEEREEWDEKNGKGEITAHYIVVKARQCRKCGKYEILDGNVNVRDSGEYMLDPDGSWGFGIST